MLTGVHFLLTYGCNSRCDHCFLYSGPEAKGTFTVELIRRALEEIAKLGTIKTVYFEGGEPFLYYPLMVEGIRLAREMGLATGIVTNSYWALTEPDAELWLKPLAELGLGKLSVSDDPLHYGDIGETPAKKALAAAAKLGIPAGAICTEKPRVEKLPDGSERLAGGVIFKGRAVEKFSGGLPRVNWRELTACKLEDLRNPGRVHVDPYGYVHLCQGLVMGNMWEKPISRIVPEYDPDAHPICGPLLAGGPALLAEKYGVRREEGYISACHLCYLARLALVERFPRYLAPRQVYGLA